MSNGKKVAIAVAFVGLAAGAVALIKKGGISGLKNTVKKLTEDTIVNSRKKFNDLCDCCIPQYISDAIEKPAWKKIHENNGGVDEFKKVLGEFHDKITGKMTESAKDAINVSNPRVKNDIRNNVENNLRKFINDQLQGLKKKKDISQKLEDIKFKIEDEQAIYFTDELFNRYIKAASDVLNAEKAKINKA